MGRQRLLMSAVILISSYLLIKKKKRRRWWVRPIFQNRLGQGHYHNLLQEMRVTDVELFFNYSRLTIEQFDHLLSLVGPLIKKHSYREPIAPAARLALTLR